MKADRRYLLLCVLLIGGCAGLGGGLFSDEPQRETRKAVRLEAVLLEAQDLAGSALQVTIRQDRILLEGFVETTSQRQRAEDLMRKNSDIDTVTNRIIVK